MRSASKKPTSSNAGLRLSSRNGLKRRNDVAKVADCKKNLANSNQIVRTERFVATDECVSLKKPKTLYQRLCENQLQLTEISAKISTNDTNQSENSCDSRNSRNKRKRKREKQRRRAEDCINPEKNLQSSKFRFLNQFLYTNDGSKCYELFNDDKRLYEEYHVGYRNQVAKWSVNPLDLIIANINRMPRTHVVADMGCGDARLAAEVHQPHVHSFDLVAHSERVCACDMARVPLAAGCVHVVVFCLSLMALDVGAYILEANRLLKIGGQMKIAEIASRFDDVNDFIKRMLSYGFKLISKDVTSYKYFYLFSFRKSLSVGKRGTKVLPSIRLKPCLYKPR